LFGGLLYLKLNG